MKRRTVIINAVLGAALLAVGGLTAVSVAAGNAQPPATGATVRVEPWHRDRHGHRHRQRGGRVDRVGERPRHRRRDQDLRHTGPAGRQGRQAAQDRRHVRPGRPEDGPVDPGLGRGVDDHHPPGPLQPGPGRRRRRGAQRPDLAGQRPDGAEPGPVQLPARQAPAGQAGPLGAEQPRRAPSSSSPTTRTPSTPRRRRWQAPRPPATPRPSASSRAPSPGCRRRSPPTRPLSTAPASGSPRPSRPATRRCWPAGRPSRPSRARSTRPPTP